MAYTIQTKSGPRGPFSIDQLQAMVDAGKLPLTFSVTELASGLLMDVKDLCSPPALIDDGGHEDESSETDASPEVALQRHAPSRAGRRSTGGRVSSRGRGGSRRNGGRASGRAFAAPVPARKNVVLGVILAFFFGPLGLLYSSWKAALLLFVGLLCATGLAFLVIVDQISGPAATDDPSAAAVGSALFLIGLPILSGVVAAITAGVICSKGNQAANRLLNGRRR
ncbi:MAG: hypothetical protein AB7O52_19665 [Planctomycetota bacterium]